VKNGHFWRFFLVLYAITAIMNVVVGFVDENYAHSLIWCVVLFLSIPLVWHECAPKADPERKMIENAYPKNIRWKVKPDIVRKAFDL